MLCIAICDDERKDIVLLKSILQDVVGKYTADYDIREYGSGVELMQAAARFQLVFLDIVMNGEDGIEVGKYIHRKNRAARIIFQTNFGQFCKEAMNRTHAFAFLEKPLKAAAVEEQVRDFFEDGMGTQDLVVDFPDVCCVAGGRSMVKSIVSVPIKEIVYCEYLKSQKRIRIVTQSVEYIYAGVMKRLEERMKPLGFETCCRGILVNMAHVLRIRMYHVVLDTGISVPLSQRRVKEFRERINEYLQDSFHER